MTLGLSPFPGTAKNGRRAKSWRGGGLRDEDKGGAVGGAVYLKGVEKGNLAVGLGLELEKEFPLG